MVLLDAGVVKEGMNCRTVLYGYDDTLASRCASLHDFRLSCFMVEADVIMS